MKTASRNQLLFGTLLFVLATIPATLFLSQQNQEARSRASASTTLAFTPSATSTLPLQKAVGDTVSFDIMVNPGSNLPSLVKLELQYDPTKFQAGATPFVTNSTAFPTIVEGPVVQDGKVLVSVSIGSDTTKAIQTTTKVGTLTLRAISPTTTDPTALTFGSRSQVLSVSTADQAAENVLSTTLPTYVFLSSPIQTSITPSAGPTVNTPSPTATVTPTLTLTATPTTPASGSSTILSFVAFLHGIGKSGDNANPNGSDLSTKTPLHPNRQVLVALYNDQNQLTATRSGTISYNSTNGNFAGSVDFGNAVPTGDYTVRIKEDTHLRRLIPGIHHITALQTNPMDTVSLVAGDVNSDNILNVLDYNLLIGCYSDLLPAVACNDTLKGITDLNDDGGVNQFDYNLFLREITVQNGN